MPAANVGWIFVERLRYDYIAGEPTSRLGAAAGIAAGFFPGGKAILKGGLKAGTRGASKWGRNRLVKELHGRGFVLSGPTKSGDGLLYKNAATGEELRIMPRPSQRYRNDAAAKHEPDYYYRYRSGPDQGWGPHTSLPNK
jgi:hypothetical protein